MKNYTLTAATQNQVERQLAEVRRDYANQVVIASPISPIIRMNRPTEYVCYVSARTEQEHSAMQYQIAEYSKLSYKGD